MLWECRWKKNRQGAPEARIRGESENENPKRKGDTKPFGAGGGGGI